MPRKRNTHRFRRGSEQKYLRTSFQSTRTARTVKTTSPAFAMPNWLMLAVMFSLGVVVTFSILRLQPTHYLSTIANTKLPQISVPHVSLPNVTLPDVKVPAISLPTVSIPKITMPSLPQINVPQAPKVSLPQVSLPTLSMPSIRIDLNPLILAIQTAVTAAQGAGTKMLEYLNPQPFISASISVTQSLLRVTSATILKTLTRLDPRPYLPAVGQGIQTLSQTIYTGLLRVAAFVNPMPLLNAMTRAHVQTYNQVVTFTITSVTYLWHGLVYALEILLHVLTTIAMFFWNVIVWIGETIKSIVVAVFRFVVWVIQGTSNTIVNIFKAIARGIQGFINATKQMATAIRNFFRPYVQFVAQSFSNGISYLQTSSEQSKQMMGGLVNQYNEGVQSINK